LNIYRLNPNVSDSVRVLVVDDSEFFGTLVAGELSKRYDMETVQTDNADDALAYLDSHEVDCVVSDYDMPGTDGIELFHRIEDRGIDVPFFLLTAAGSEEVASEAITAGIDDYFPKTKGEEQFEILGRRITNVVEQQRTENRLQRQRQLHGNLWSITQEHMSATSRAEIATSVCAGLTSVDRFEFAWLTDEQAATPDSDPVAVAGLDTETLGAVRDEAATHEQAPITGALETQTVQTAQLETAEAVTLAAIPLVHQERSYGALAVATRPNSPLRPSDRETLAHLGTTVGHALAAVEMQREIEIFREAVDQADTAILITDREGVVEYANSACTDITGYNVDEIVGQPVEILATDRWDREYYESLWETVRAGDAVRDEIVQRKADGAQFYVDLSVAPVRLGERVEKFILVESDITVLKSNEQRLEVLNRVLRHNLRNDLNVIQGNLSLVLETLGTGEEHSRIELAQQKVDELLTLGEKAQFVNKTVGAADEQEEHRPVELDEMLVREARQAREAYPDATVELDVEGGLSTRGTQLHVAVRELLVNAIEHNDGDPAVTVRTVRDQSPDGTVYVDVEDNGPGIPDNERETLSRGRETDLLHGSSLGLWLVHWLITHAGGSLSIENTDESGSVIRLALPLVEP
jgi:PAS domain S-box-containing protein